MNISIVKVLETFDILSETSTRSACVCVVCRWLIPVLFPRCSTTWCGRSARASATTAAPPTGTSSGRRAGKSSAPSCRPAGPARGPRAPPAGPLARAVQWLVECALVTALLTYVRPHWCWCPGVSVTQCPSVPVTRRRRSATTPYT